MIKLKIEVDFEEKKSNLFFKSIEPELKETFSRSETKVFKKKNKLIFEIRASDKAAARASLNSIKKPLELFTKLEEL